MGQKGANLMNIAIGLIIVIIAGFFLLAFVAAGASAKKNSKYGGKDDKNFDAGTVHHKWREIRGSMSSPSGIKNALIETDKLLDYVLKGKGYRGDTMAKRLSAAS